MENNKNDQTFTVWAIVITLAIIVGTGYFVMNRQAGNSGSQGQDLAAAGNTAPTAPAAPAGSVPVDISKVNTTNEPFVGKADAPVTVALWFDYQCPFCQRLEESMMPSLLTDYINKGQVKVVYKDFPFLGPDSETVSEIARAVWAVDPSKFYAWNSMIFNNQGAEGSGWATKDKILAMTKTISGLDEAKVEQLLAANSSQYAQEIAADKAEGSSFGISGTPAMIIGTQLVVGAQPYASIKQIIDLELAKK